MAFTIAHMAAALPFKRSTRWLNFEALLLGTMLPDLPYFLPRFLDQTGTAAQQSHQWLGIVSYCLPWGLLIILLWFYLLKPAAQALGQPWYNALQSQSHFLHYHTSHNSFNYQILSSIKPHLVFWLTVVCGLIVGAATHLLWDGITHPNGFIAQHIGWLQYSFTLIGLGDMTIARTLQYLSSLGALGLLARFAYTSLAKYRIYPLSSKQRYISVNTSDAFPLSLNKSYSLFVLALIVSSALVGSLLAALKWQHVFSTHSYYFFAEVSVGFVKGAGVAFIVYLVVYYVVRLWRQIMSTRQGS